MPIIDIGNWRKQDEFQKWISGKKVKAWMLFPEDGKLRDDYVVLSVATVLADQYECKKLPPVKLSKWIEKYLYRAGGFKGLIFSGDANEVMSVAHKRYAQGIIVGLLLIQIELLNKSLKSAPLNKRPSVNKAAAVIESLYQNTIFQSTRTEAKDYWKLLKRTAHLWATHVVFLRDSIDGDAIRKKDEAIFFSIEDYAFRNLPNFFSIANFYLGFGESFSARDRKKTLFMQSDDMILSPKEYSSNLVDPAWPNSDTTDQIKSILEQYQAPKSFT